MNCSPRSTWTKEVYSFDIGAYLCLNVSISSQHTYMYVTYARCKAQYKPVGMSEPRLNPLTLDVL